MKKVLAIACLLVVLTFAMVTMASAQTQSNWRFNIKSDDGAGMYSGSTTTIGVLSTSLDGPVSDTQDVKLAATRTGSSKVVVSVFNSTCWTKDVKSGAVPKAYPNGEKIWDLRVVGLGAAATTTPIRLSFTTISATMLPVSTLPPTGGPAQYWMRMINNKGIEGTPANYDPLKTQAQNIAAGAVWSIPIPTVHSTTVPYYTLTLPTINVTSTQDANIIAEGYEMQFYQTPEPSSFLALGTGLMGLAGLASRRRRS